MRLIFLTIVLLSSSCMLAADNLKSFAPIFHNFGLNSGKLVPSPASKIFSISSKNVIDSRKNETGKIENKEEEKCCQENRLPVERTVQVDRLKGKITRTKENRKRQRKIRNKERRSKRRHEKKRKKRRRVKNNEKKARGLKNDNNKKKRTRLNNNNKNSTTTITNNNNKSRNNGRSLVPLCLVRCLTANLMHPAHCHVLCS